MKKLVLFCLIFATTHIFAQKVAVVLSTSNKVTATHNGATRTLSRGSPLEPGDAITTAANAQANIRYLNGTLVNISANSNYKIIAYSSKTSDVQIKAQLNEGTIYSKTTGKTKEELKTPVTALAILGTKYAVDVKNKRQTYVTVSEGHVEANGVVFGPGSSILITPNGITNAQFPQQGRLETENNILDLEVDSDSSGSEGTESAEAETPEAGTDLAEADIEPPIDISAADTGVEDLVGLTDTTLVVSDIGTEETQCEHGNEIFLH
ncbi:FecR family protein [Legionella fallonii]|uniref:FecR protein domain-containing protein n=1 Tax=Legionella fallonii LLAP-10 TaxID=1212491 RepID=A0A098G5E4_9GAMM|nr:FecR family protein [Legionella fallonii]CEG57201.1 conserved exported protein of unknown function [Legionella fallonii LLAP-10]